MSNHKSVVLNDGIKPDATLAAKAEDAWKTIVELLSEHHSVTVEYDTQLGAHVATAWDSEPETLEGCRWTTAEAADGSMAKVLFVKGGDGRERVFWDRPLSDRGFNQVRGESQ